MVAEEAVAGTVVVTTIRVMQAVAVPVSSLVTQDAKRLTAMEIKYPAQSISLATNFYLGQQVL